MSFLGAMLTGDRLGRCWDFIEHAVRAIKAQGTKVYA